MPLLAERTDPFDSADACALVTFGSPAITYRDEARLLLDQSGQVDFHKTKYWQDLQLRPAFIRARERLEQMANLRQNWDTYGAEPPSRDARESAADILVVLQRMSLLPTKVVPSSEGGVAICFIKGDRYADIECLNTGETLAVTYRGTDEPHAWEIEGQDASLKEALERIRAHFAA